MTLLDPAPEVPAIELTGLEPDNLLAFLALLGLLRALEVARPDWRPRVSWKGPPWKAQLHLSAVLEKLDVGLAASEGIAAVCEHFDAAGHKNASFTLDEYRAYAEGMRSNVVGAALVSALAAERPQKKAGGVMAAPLVMMFGGGHQHFLERLIEVPRAEVPEGELKSTPDVRGSHKIAEALFEPWRRIDRSDAFRWDPEDNQRYALRFGDPSPAGAAPTVHGANRLAAVGFLSFAAAPAERQTQVIGSVRDHGEWRFVWPIWSRPLSRIAIENLLVHPDLLRGARSRVSPLGVCDVLRARRIANAKLMNVTRAEPV